MVVLRPGLCGPPVHRWRLDELLHRPAAPHPKPYGSRRPLCLPLPSAAGTHLHRLRHGLFRPRPRGHWSPFRWDADRRAVIRAELDALFFHLYGITRDDTAYILDTFNVTRDNDVKAHGEYRTKTLILAEYDRMAAAGLTLETPLDESETGTYRSTLTPPPGHGPRHN